MIDIQNELNLSSFVTAKDKLSSAKKKHQIKGRPRRLPAIPVGLIEALAALPWGIEISTEEWTLAIDDYVAKKKAKSQVELAIENVSVKSQVIKVAIDKSTVEILDRLRANIPGGSTRPDFIRMIVDEFIKEKHEPLCYARQDGKINRRKAKEGRCMYIKIYFSPEAMVAIGHHDPMSGLCMAFGMTRQGVVNESIDWYLEKLK